MARRLQTDRRCRIGLDHPKDGSLRRVVGGCRLTSVLRAACAAWLMVRNSIGVGRPGRRYRNPPRPDPSSNVLSGRLLVNFLDRNCNIRSRSRCRCRCRCGRRQVGIRNETALRMPDTALPAFIREAMHYPALHLGVSLTARGCLAQAPFLTDPRAKSAAWNTSGRHGSPTPVSQARVLGRCAAEYLNCGSSCTATAE